MKEQVAERDGIATAIEAGGFHRVELDGNGHKVLARKSGPMVKNRIVVVVGDKVKEPNAAFYGASTPTATLTGHSKLRARQWTPILCDVLG
jgi:translation initiation factor IF-1